MVIDQLLGHYFCADCEAEHPGPQPTQKTWRAAGGRILCREHFVAVMARAPVEEQRAPAPPLPPATGKWAKVVDGLRARIRASGVEIQGVRNVRMENADGVGSRTMELSDGCRWVLTETELIELFLLASEYRDSPELLKVQVRLQLHRIFHGTEKP